MVLDCRWHLAPHLARSFGGLAQKLCIIFELRCLLQPPYMVLRERAAAGCVALDDASFQSPSATPDAAELRNSWLTVLHG